MKKTILVTITVFVLCFLGFGPGTNSRLHDQEDLRTQMLEQAMESVVAIYYPDSDVPASGFYVGDGVIVTAGHCVDGAERVAFGGGTEFEVVSSFENQDVDCGLLVIEAVNRPALVLDLKPAKRGTEVFVLGHPHFNSGSSGESIMFNATRGMVTAIQFNEFFGSEVLIVDAIAHPGNSGSAIVDIDGEVRGVHVGGWLMRGIPIHGSETGIQVVDIMTTIEAMQ